MPFLKPNKKVIYKYFIIYDYLYTYYDYTTYQHSKSYQILNYISKIQCYYNTTYSLHPCFHDFYIIIYVHIESDN